MPDFGKVEGQYFTIIVDGDDQDLTPDILALKGTVTFTLTTSEFAEAGAQPNPKSFGTSPIVSTLDAAGYLTTPTFGGGASTQRGIWLIATDSSGINPTNLQYEVVFDLKAPDNRPIPFKTQYISVPKTAGANSPVWLNAVSEQPSAPPLTSAAATALLALALQAAQGSIRALVAGTNISIDNTDPLRPIISASGGGGGGSGTVSSVNGKQPNGAGAVTLVFSDLGAISVLPSDVGISATGQRVPISSAPGAWLNNGLTVNQSASANSLVQRSSTGQVAVATSTVDGNAVPKLQMDTALSLKADTSAVTTSLAAKADLVGGLIPQAQLPPLAISEYLGSSADQAAMLGKIGQRGDWTTRADRSTVFMLIADTPAQLSSWQEFSYPISPIISVAGRTGAITLSIADIGGLPERMVDLDGNIAAVNSLNSIIVRNFGNQSIDGIKAFIQSPTVPTPTTATQASNKAYVDSLKSYVDGLLALRLPQAISRSAFDLLTPPTPGKYYFVMTDADYAAMQQEMGA